MTLPTLVKTWQYNVNQLVTNQGTALANNRRNLRTIKDSMLGFGTKPWTVVGSSNSTTAALDGSDRWAADANLVWAAAGTAHSWLVIKQANIATNYSICIDLIPAAANGDTISFVLSPVAGFTGGSTTNRPTATDENSSWTDLPWSNISTVDSRVHVMQSDDGQCTRVVVWASNAQKIFWLFDKPQNPVSGWTNPSVTGINSGSSAMNVSSFNTGAGPARGYGTAIFNINYDTEGYASGSIIANQASSNDLSTNYPMLPIGLSSAPAGHRGKHGTLFDLWAGLAVVADKDTYPSDGSNQFVEFGDLIFPWNGSTPTTA